MMSHCSTCTGYHPTHESCIRQDEPVINRAQFPTAPHWAIIIFDNVSANDNWGGSATRHLGDYHVYFTESVWKKKITELSLPKKYGDNKEFVAFRSSGPANIKPIFSVEVTDVVE